jgi:hypothetical protein
MRLARTSTRWPQDTRGPNAVVVEGACPVYAASTKLAEDSTRVILAIWMLSAGQWAYYLPFFADIDGSLSRCPGPLASTIIVLG